MREFIYRIYGQNKKKGWEIIDTKIDKEEAISIARGLSSEEYYKYLIIEHDCKHNCDFPIESEDLYQECKVKYENIKTGIEVKAMEIRPYSRTKNKQELKKLTQDYIDR